MGTTQTGPDRSLQRRVRIIFLIVGILIGVLLTLAVQFFFLKPPPGDPPPTVTAPAEARP